MDFSKYNIPICRTDGTKKYIYDEVRQEESYGSFVNGIEFDKVYHI